MRLRGYAPKEVRKKLSEWTDELTNEKHLLEALRLQQSLGAMDPDLFSKLIESKEPQIAAAAFGCYRFVKNYAPPLLIRMLDYGANHSSQHVRREAVLRASYLLASEHNPPSGNYDFVIPEGQRQSIVEAISPVLNQPAGVHLSYAITSAFNSAALKPYWLPETAEKLKKFVPPKKQNKEQKKFDRQKNLATIKIGIIPERLLFTQTEFTVTAGQPVKLVFENTDATDHNLLILAKDTPIQEIGEAANEMARDLEAAKKHYIPKDQRVIHSTRMLKKGQSQTLRFIAPIEPGTYPYLCTFPGHWIIMKGEMIVRP